MRSLQVKVSGLLVALLVVACVSLALIATEHERSALEAEVEKRARGLAASLAGAAKEPLLLWGDPGKLRALGGEPGKYEAELTLDRLVAEIGEGEGVVAVRLLGPKGEVLASLDPAEVGAPGHPLPAAAGREAALQVERAGDQLLVDAPVLYSGVRIGVTQVALDLRVLVEPVVKSSARQLTAAAGGVVGLGVLAGMVFVTLLVRPLRRLRVGVEALSQGDLSMRVPPTSRDEVGELTRAFNEMGDSLLQKQRIQKAFGRYVNDYVLNQLLEGPDGTSTSGMEREVTILFADIRSFTRLSEGMLAKDVVALLNEVFQLLSDCILERGGTIDKFIGDSVMAYFGAPLRQPDHALRAVYAAIDITRIIEERSRRAKNREPGAPLVPVQIGIGIHTGPVVVGNIGSDRRTDFTAVGDVVNVAHRLEKLARPGETLVSEAVQRRVRTAVRLRFEGERQLSGREEPVHVYALELERAGGARSLARSA